MMKGDILGVNETTSSLAGKTATPQQTVASTLYSKDGDEEGEEEE